MPSQSDQPQSQDEREQLLEFFSHHNQAIPELEEKKEILLSWQPHPITKNVEKALYEFELQIERPISKNQTSDILIIIKTVPSLYVHAGEVRTISSNDDILIFLYNRIYQIRRNSYTSMQPSDEPLEKKDEYIAEHKKLNSGLFDKILAEKHIDIWNYLTNINNEVTRAILQKIVLLILSVNYDKDNILFLQRLLERYREQRIENIRDKQDIVVVLEYFIWLEKQEPVLAGSSLSKNILIQAHLILSIPGMPSEKISKIMNLVKSPLEYDHYVLPSTIEFVMFKLTGCFYANVNANIADIVLSESMRQKLEKANFTYPFNADLSLSYYDNLVCFQIKLNNLNCRYGVNANKSLLSKERALISCHSIVHISSNYAKLFEIDLNELQKYSNFLIKDGNIALLQLDKQQQVCDNLLKILCIKIKTPGFDTIAVQCIKYLFEHDNNAALQFMFNAYIALVGDKSRKNDYKVVQSLCEFYFDLKESMYDSWALVYEKIRGFISKVEKSHYLFMNHDKKFMFPELFVDLKRILGNAFLSLCEVVNKNIGNVGVPVTASDMDVMREADIVFSRLVGKGEVFQEFSTSEEEFAHYQRIQQFICDCAENHIDMLRSGTEVSLPRLKKLRNAIVKFCNGSANLFPEHVQIETCEAIAKLNYNLSFETGTLQAYSEVLFLKGSDIAFNAICLAAFKYGKREHSLSSEFFVIFSAHSFYLDLKNVIKGKNQFYSIKKNILNNTYHFKDQSFWESLTSYYENGHVQELKTRFKSDLFSVITIIIDENDKYEFLFQSKRSLRTFYGIMDKLLKVLGATDLELADLKGKMVVDKYLSLPPAHIEEKSEAPVALPDQEVELIESKALLFKPSQCVVDFEVHIDRCLDAIDACIKAGKNKLPAFILETKLDDIVDPDEKSQRIIDFYKLFFRLVINKEYADLASFEKLQNEVRQCLLKINNKDEEGEIWNYLINTRNHMGFRLLRLQWMAYDNKHLSFSDIFLETDNNNVVMDYFGKTEEMNLDEGALSAIPNVLVKAKIILSNHKLRKYIHLLTPEPFKTEPATPSIESYFFKNYLLAIFILSIYDYEDDFSFHRRFIKELAGKNYVIDFSENKGPRTITNFLYGIMQLRKNLQSFIYHDCRDNLGFFADGRLKKLFIAVTKKYLLLFNNNSDSDLSPEVLNDLREGVDYLMKNEKPYLLPWVLDCVVKISSKNLPNKGKLSTFIKRVDSWLLSIDIPAFIENDNDVFSSFQKDVLDLAIKLGAKEDQMNSLKRALQVPVSCQSEELNNTQPILRCAQDDKEPQLPCHPEQSEGSSELQESSRIVQDDKEIDLLKSVRIELPVIEMPAVLPELEPTNINQDVPETDIACLSISDEELVPDLYVEQKKSPKQIIIPRSKILDSILHFARQVYKITKHPLVITGGALVYWLQEQENPKEHDIDVIVFSELNFFYGLWSLAHTSELIPCSHHPIVESVLLEGCDLIPVDISCYPHTGNDPVMVEDTLEKIMRTRDFKLCGLYMVMYPLDAESFEIKGFDGAVVSVQKKRIEYVDINVFKDLICFFRLVKLYCKHNDFINGPDLEHLLLEIKKSSNFMFYDFIYNQGGLPQINTRINELFKKRTYDPVKVLEWFCILPIMEGMTRMTNYTIILETKEILADYVNEVRKRIYNKENYYFPYAHSFYYFSYAHLYYSQQANQHMIQLYVKAVKSRMPKAEKANILANLAYIERNSSHDTPMEQHLDLDFLFMIFKIKSKYPLSKMNVMFFQNAKDFEEEKQKVRKPQDLENPFAHFPSAVLMRPEIKPSLTEWTENPAHETVLPLAATPKLPPSSPVITRMTNNENLLFTQPRSFSTRPTEVVQITYPSSVSVQSRTTQGVTTASKKQQLQILKRPLPETPAQLPSAKPGTSSLQSSRQLSPQSRLFVNNLRSVAQQTAPLKSNQNLKK